MSNRKNKLEQNRNMQIDMRPEFATALQNCLNFSRTYFFAVIFIDEKGKSVNLLKGSSKRKRTRAELEDVKEEEMKLKEDKQEYFSQNKKLRIENQELQDQLIELQQLAQEYIQSQNLNQVRDNQQEFVI